MKKWFILFAGISAATMAAPAASMAQGIGIDLPGVGVRVGEPYGHRYYSDWDSPRVYHRPAWREREVYLGTNSNCRTVTIQRDDGSMKRIRRCD